MPLEFLRALMGALAILNHWCVYFILTNACKYFWNVTYHRFQFKNPALDLLHGPLVMNFCFKAFFTTRQTIFCYSVAQKKTPNSLMTTKNWAKFFYPPIKTFLKPLTSISLDINFKSSKKKKKVWSRTRKKLTWPKNAIMLLEVIQKWRHLKVNNQHP